MFRLLIAAVAIVALFWWWDQPGGFRSSCETIAYPVRCQGATIGNRCHGELGDALPRRVFRVDAAANRVTENGAAASEIHPRCRVTDCGEWECVDEIFVRTAHGGDFSEQLRPGLTPVDPLRTLSQVYVPQWKWWEQRARAFAQRTTRRFMR